MGGNKSRDGTIKPSPPRPKPNMSIEKSSIVSDLEERQNEIQAAIQDAARNGGNSMKLRQELKDVQQKLQAVRADVASMQAAGRQAASRATGQAGNALAGAAIDRIMGAADPFAELLANGVPAVDFTGVPAVQAAAHNVAAARTILNDALGDHESATRDVEDLTSKITSKRHRHSELTRQRVETGSESGAAELYAISEDVKTLDEMRIAAQTKADRLMAAVNEARPALTAAEKQAAKVEAQLAARHLADHAGALERAYLACLRECQSVAAKAGVTLGSLHQATHELKAYAATSILQTPFARART
jgi:chromosome segregation ATPase